MTFAGILKFFFASANALEGLDFPASVRQAVHFPAAANDRLETGFHQQMRHHIRRGTCEECAVCGMHAFGSWEIDCSLPANHNFDMHSISLAWRPVA
jgi:hypothetical protein